MIRCAEVGGDLEGTSIFRVAPPISHLLFPDDYFLFYKAEQRQAQTMQNIFKMYKESSGQFISMPKSKIFYSRNVPVDLTNSIKNIMGVQEVHGTKKYLGLPSMIEIDLTTMSSYIKDRDPNKISSWIINCLSKAKREVMIKSVLQAIPSYVMSIFILPITIIFTIETMMNLFSGGMGELIIMASIECRGRSYKCTRIIEAWFQ